MKLNRLKLAYEIEPFNIGNGNYSPAYRASYKFAVLWSIFGVEQLGHRLLLIPLELPCVNISSKITQIPTCVLSKM